MDNSFFPIPFPMHIILALLAVFVFGLQFIRYRKSYYFVLAVALPCTLLPYLTDSLSFFYGVGVFEVAALLLALILAKTVDRRKNEEPSGGEPVSDSEGEPGEETESAPEENAGGENTAS